MEEMEEIFPCNHHLKKIFKIISQPEVLAVLKIPEDELLVLQLIWERNLTLPAIGKKFHLSGERIRQIYARALKRINFSIIAASEKYKLLEELQEQNKKLIEENKKLHKELLPYLKENLVKSEASQFSELLKTPITDIHFSVRTFNCLSHFKIETVEDLLKYSKEDLLSFPNLGTKSVTEIEHELQSRGLQLRE